MNIPMKLYQTSLLLLLLFIVSCKKKGKDQATPSFQYLVESSFIGEFDAKTIKARYPDSPTINNLSLSTIRVYKVVYKTTDISGKNINVSGALIFPTQNKPYALVSYQHGTIIDERLTPSNYRPDSGSYDSGTVLAGLGYVVALPDYIGYGASKDLKHPYEHAASLASTSRDMIRATREFCKANKVILNNQLFLTGYSEGGYATMALHKLLEEKHSDEFTITASAPGAGAYDKTTFAQAMFASNEDLEFINNYLWVLDTYNKAYGLNRSFSDFVNEPYASQLTNAAPAIGIQTVVAKNPQVLFKQSFVDGIKNGTDVAFLNALKDNDIYNWKPKAPMRMYHGNIDNFVPFFNSQNALDAMHAKGATQVELITIDGGDHFTSVPSYILGIFDYFKGFSQ